MENKSDKKNDPAAAAETDAATETSATTSRDQMIEEHGGPKGPEPTRYGDWEQKGRCTDF